MVEEFSEKWVFHKIFLRILFGIYILCFLKKNVNDNMGRFADVFWRSDNCYILD